MTKCKAPLGAVAVLTLLAFGSSADAPRPHAARPPRLTAASSTDYGKLPLTFEQNTGLYDRRVRFVSRLGSATLFLTDTEAVMVLAGVERGKGKGESTESKVESRKSKDRRGPLAPSPRLRGEGWGEGKAAATAHVLRMKLAGSKGASSTVGLEKQRGIVNYFIGRDPKKWRTRVPTYARVKMAGVYPGIDLVYYQAPDEKRRRLEYDFVVKPGADPKRIRLAFEGAERLRLVGGDLVLTTPVGEVRMKRPVAYQTIGGQRVTVACSYALRGTSAAVQVARYDASRTLVVDPGLVYSTYLGGSGDDGGPDGGLAVDAAGSVYATGYTCSADYPTTAGAYDATYNGASPRSDVCVSKLNSAGSALVYSTYLGGLDNECGRDLAVDGSGCAYVTGYTYSSDFPTTSGAFDTSYNGSGTDRDVFVAKLGAAGTSLAYSTFLGGTADDNGGGIAVDSSGSAHVVGSTSSSGFPTSSGAHDRSFSGGDAYVTKLNAAGSALTYSTFVGGSSYEYGTDIALGSGGTAYVTGYTASSDFPTTTGAYDRTRSGLGPDAFVTKLNSSGSSLSYSTFLGGSGSELARAIAVDSSGAAYASGETESADFPTSAGACDASLGGARDAYVTKLNSTGSALVYSTYLGGAAKDYARGIAVDTTGAAYVTGHTQSADFPTTPGAYDRSHNGGGYYGDDCFIGVLAPDGQALAYGTFVGGSGDDQGYRVAVDASAACYVAGVTVSADFPTTPGACDVTYAHGEIFVLKITFPAMTVLAAQDALGGYYGQVALAAVLTCQGVWVPGKSVAFSVHGTSVGSGVTNSSGRATVQYVIPTSLPVGVCAIDASFSGDGDYTASSDSATLTVTKAGTTLTDPSRSGSVGDMITISSVLRRSTDDALLAAKTVDFLDSGTSIGTADTNGSGLATKLYEVPEGVGETDIGVLFRGDELHSACSRPGTLTVNKADTSLALPSSAGQVGETVVLSTTLRRVTDGAALSGKTVSFAVAGANIGSDETDEFGVASKEYTIPEGVGRKFIEVSFAGDANHNASVTTGDTLIVNKARTALAVSDRSGEFGASVDLAATLTRETDAAPLNGRTVSFGVEGSGVGSGTTDVSGVATLTYTIPEGLGDGAKTISAEFAGDANYEAASGTGTLTVSKCATTLTVGNSSGQVGASVSLSATLSRTAGGALGGMTVDFTVDGTAAGSSVTDGSGLAALAHAIPENSGAGERAIGARFSGDALNAYSTGTGTLAVTKAPTTLYTIDRSGTITENVILRQYDLKRTTDNAPLDGKTIAFLIDGTAVGTATTNAGGDSPLNWTVADGPATRTITAAFAGDAAYNGCSDDAILTATVWATKMVGFDRTQRIAARTELKARLLRSDNVALYNKAIDFSVDGTFVITRPTDVQGYAKYPTYTIPDGAGAGARPILSSWAGNGGYLPVAKTATLTVSPALPYIWVLPKTVASGAKVGLYAYFRRLPDYQKQAGRTVDFRVDGTFVASAVTDAGGVARYSYQTVEAVGDHTIRCEFAGDAWVDAGSGEGLLRVY